jgi:hypothetical protein
MYMSFKEFSFGKDELWRLFLIRLGIVVKFSSFGLKLVSDVRRENFQVEILNNTFTNLENV